MSEGYIPSDRLMEEVFDNEIYAKAKEALAPMRELYDLLEDRIASAVEEEDICTVLKLSWTYGVVAKLVSEIETTLDGPFPE
jgi:hypothetical protein